MRRVVVTGLGAITPIGNNVKECWESLINGKNGINEITHFDTTNFKTKLAAVGTAEKGYVDMKITLHDKGGHTSAAPKHSGMAKLANAVQDLENHQFRSHWLPFLSELLDTLASRATFFGKIFIGNYPPFIPLLKLILKLIHRIN